LSWALVLTKMDKLKKQEQDAVIAAAEKEAATHVAAWPGVFATSSEKGLGIAELRAHITDLSRPNPNAMDA